EGLADWHAASNQGLLLPLGAVVGQGVRASFRKPCLDKSCLLWLEEIPIFREENCIHCRRPVFTPAKWEPKRPSVRPNAEVPAKRHESRNFAPCAEPNANACGAVGSSRRNVPMHVTARLLANRRLTGGAWQIGCKSRPTRLSPSSCRASKPRCTA